MAGLVHLEYFPKAAEGAMIMMALLDVASRAPVDTFMRTGGDIPNLAQLDMCGEAAEGAIRVMALPGVARQPVIITNVQVA
jgi:hypothetical protein